MMEILSLGQKLKKLRKENGLTLKELAENRITAAQISHIERDKSYPSQDLLEYFSVKLGTTVDFLIESKDMQAKKIAVSILLKGEFLIKTGKYSEAKKEISRVLLLCNEYELSEETSRANYLYAIIYKEEKHYKKAIQMCEKSLVGYLQLFNWEGAARSYFELGTIYTLDGYYVPASNMLHQAYDIIKKIKLSDINFENDVLTALSYAYIKSDDSAMALKYAQKAESLSSRMKDLKSKAGHFYVLANSYMQNSDYDMAKKYFNLALDTYNMQALNEEKAKAFERLSEVYKRLSDFDSALSSIQKAYQLKEHDEDEQLVNILFCYSGILSLKNEHEKSIELLNHAGIIAEKLGNKKLQSRAVKKHADILEATGEVGQAKIYLNKCMELLESIQDKKQLASVCFDAARLCEGNCRDSEIGYYTKGIALFKEIGLIEN